jgi:hypothetical protein
MSIDYFSFQTSSVSYTQDEVAFSGLKHESIFSLERKGSIPSLSAKGVSQSMRPMSIVEDQRFIDNIQQFPAWNSEESPTLICLSLLDDFLFFIPRYVSCCQWVGHHDIDADTYKKSCSLGQSNP